MIFPRTPFIIFGMSALTSSNSVVHNIKGLVHKLLITGNWKALKRRNKKVSSLMMLPIVDSGKVSQCIANHLREILCKDKQMHMRIFENIIHYLSSIPIGAVQQAFQKDISFTVVSKDSSIQIRIDSHSKNSRLLSRDRSLICSHIAPAWLHYRTRPDQPYVVPDRPIPFGTDRRDLESRQTARSQQTRQRIKSGTSSW